MTATKRSPRPWDKGQIESQAGCFTKARPAAVKAGPVPGGELEPDIDTCFDLADCMMGAARLAARRRRWADAFRILGLARGQLASAAVQIGQFQEDTKRPGPSPLYLSFAEFCRLPDSVKSAAYKISPDELRRKYLAKKGGAS